MRIPFFFAGPGIEARVVREPVSLLDMYPTVASLLGLTPPHDLDGQDLSPVLTSGETPRGVAISSWVVGWGARKIAVTARTKDYRLIRYWDDTFELYDSGNDPYENNNLVVSSGGGNLSSIVTSLMNLLPADLAPPAADPPETTASEGDGGDSAPSSAGARHLRRALRDFEVNASAVPPSCIEDLAADLVATVEDADASEAALANAARETAERIAELFLLRSTIRFDAAARKRRMEIRDALKRHGITPILREASRQGV